MKIEDKDRIGVTKRGPTARPSQYFNRDRTLLTLSKIWFGPRMELELQVCLIPIHYDLLER